MAKRTNEQGLSELREARPWTRDEGRRVFDAWVESGETVADFARRTGLDRRKIYGLRRRLGASPTKQARTAPTFLPVIVRTAPSMPRGESSAATGITVRMRKGVEVEVARLDAASAAWVATLVRSLEEVVS